SVRHTHIPDQLLPLQGEVGWGCGSHDVTHPRNGSALTSRCATEFCLPQDTYPPPHALPHTYVHSRHHAAPTQGRAGRPWERGAFPVGMETRQPGLQMVPPEAGPRTKADRDGRPLAPLLLNGRVKGRPLLVTVSRKAGRHFRTSKPVQNHPS